MNSGKGIIDKRAAFVRELTSEDTLSIQNIWKECFTKDMGYIQNFIEYCFPYSKSWGVFLNNSNIAIAMLSALPSYSILKESQNYDSRINGVYIYGVGTLKQYRKKGYSKLLMEEAINYAIERSLEYIILKPAEESLFALYQKQSFNNILKCYYVEINIPEKSKKIYFNEKSNQTNRFKTVADNNNYHLEARESLAKTNFLWPDRILQYSLLEITSRNGVTRYSAEKNRAPLFYSAYPDEAKTSTVKVIDHNILILDELKIVIDDIASQFTYAKQITLELPVETDLNIFGTYIKSAEIANNGLIKALKPISKLERHLLKMHLTLPME